MSVGSWINVMDPRFNLHLRSDSVAQAWIVRKPTADGIVTSVELFNDNGEAIAMFFGERKPGKPELTAWRALVDELLARSTAIEA
jgi:putative hemin transport protein